MKLARKIRVRIARLRRAANPVALGQSRTGFVLAALLVASWQLSVPAKADATSAGVSNDYYVRIEWAYDLELGRGWLYLGPQYPGNGRRTVLEHGRFTTAGLPFDSLEDDVPWVDIYGPPTYAGEEEGRSLYEYDLIDSIGFGYYSASSIAIALTFPTEGIELRETEFNYEGFTLSGMAGPVNRLEPASLPFVSIQTIPEPAAAASLALAAAALAATRRREGEA